ncbi:unnamed protein product [Caenorhabditis angaria]|uniref:Uncharacterized protein n=1 Tax=Caenorhabditis angaria TaxID=860376 RepID=A0A9P1IFB0_9PELO|nr:unnamed protein product [Caenorhabditis angaria]
MEHFIAICCFGGEPFIDFHLNGTFSRLDPTDWSADIITDFTSNSSSLAELITSEGVNLGECEMYNITFSNFADQFLFDTYKANFLCSCPPSRTGISCEFSAPTHLPLTDISTVTQTSLQYPMILIFATLFLVLLAVLMMMLKGLWCDCFGPCSREDPYDKPLDPEDVRKCLQKVRENQAARGILPPEQPLIQQQQQPRQLPPTAPPLSTPPSINTSYAAPYTSQPRPPSPPPAYCDIDQHPVSISQQTRI